MIYRLAPHNRPHLRPHMNDRNHYLDKRGVIRGTLSSDKVSSELVTMEVNHPYQNRLQNIPTHIHNNIHELAPLVVCFYQAWNDKRNEKLARN